MGLMKISGPLPHPVLYRTATHLSSTYQGSINAGVPELFSSTENLNVVNQNRLQVCEMVI